MTKTIERLEGAKARAQAQVTKLEAQEEQARQEEFEWVRLLENGKVHVATDFKYISYEQQLRREIRNNV